jgi:hypothetical protein
MKKAGSTLISWLIIFMCAALGGIAIAGGMMEVR